MDSLSTTYKFYCPRCDHGTDFKGNLVLHLKSKKECTITKENSTKSNISREAILETLKPPEAKLPQTECQYCNKLVGKANFARHIKTCKDKHTEKETTSNQTTQDNRIVFDTLDDFKQAVKKEIEEYLNKQPIQNNTYQIINNGTINVNSFGNENMSHINGEFLSYCIMNPKRGITELIENIHYNDDMPENKNVRFKSNKNNTFEQYTGTEWIECDASYTLDELIKKGYRLMNNHYIHTFLNENPEYIEDPIKQSAVEKFRFLTDTKNIDYHLTKRNIRLLVKNKTYYIVEPVNDTIDKNETEEQDKELS
jgi:hypothetical protein